MTTQEECIQNIMSKKRDWLFKNDGAHLIILLKKIVEHGTIKKYDIWKKLFKYLSSAKYIWDTFHMSLNALKLYINLLDNSLQLKYNEYDKVICYIIQKPKGSEDVFQTELYNRFGIGNYIHLERLIEINNKEPLHNFDKAILNYIYMKNDKDWRCTHMEFDTLLTLFSDKNLIKNIFYDENNIGKKDMFYKFIDKFKLCYHNTYEFHKFNNFINNKYNLTDDENNFIDELFDNYMLFSYHWFHKYIDDIDIKKTDRETLYEGSDTIFYDKMCGEEQIISLYNKIYILLYPTNIQEVLNSYNYKTLTIKDIILDLEGKLKSKYPFLKESSYKYIKNINKDINFTNHILKLYIDNRAILDDLIIDNFVEIINVEDFIDVTENNKSKLKYILNNKILNNVDFDYNKLIEIDFDETTMKYALMNKNIKVIKLLFEHKYSASNTELLWIYSNDTNNDNFTEIKEILDMYITYYVYMTDDVFIKFCKNNNIDEKFNYKLLKKYTINKDDDEKFNQIVNLCKQKSIKKDVTIIDIQNHISMLNRSNKCISKDDLYLFADNNMKFLLDEYFNKN